MSRGGRWSDVSGSGDFGSKDGGGGKGDGKGRDVCEGGTRGMDEVGCVYSRTTGASSDGVDI